MRELNAKKGIGLAFVLALLAAALTVAPAAADDVPTDANVSGSLDAPTIECTWVLPDQNGYWPDGMQYGGDDSGASTDLPCTAPSPTSKAGPNDGANNLIQVEPNAHDETIFGPSLQWIEIWSAIDEELENETIVAFDVYHPDGSLKANIPATRLEVSPDQKHCDTPGGMLGAAQGTGQLTSTATQAVVWECQNQKKSFFYGAFGLSKHQPWGTYTVITNAQTLGGGNSFNTVTFEVLPFVQLEKDFTQVSFGNVGPNGHFFSEPGGDFDWNDGNVEGTSIRNTGNAGMNLELWFDPLCLEGNPLFCGQVSKTIDTFDVKFGADLGPETLLEEIDPIPANTPVMFGNAENTTLCPNQIGKIEFSIHTGSILNGPYFGVPVGIHLTGVGSLMNGGHACNTDLLTPDPGYENAPYANGYWNP